MVIWFLLFGGFFLFWFSSLMISRCCSQWLIGHRLHVFPCHAAWAESHNLRLCPFDALSEGGAIISSHSDDSFLFISTCFIYAQFG